MNLISTSLISIFNISLRIIFGLLINKIIAITAGPAGITIFAQFQNIIQLSVQGSQAGILPGYSKYLTIYGKRSQIRSILHQTTLALLAVTTLLSIFVIYVFNEHILSVMDESEFSQYFLYLISVSLIFYNLGAYLIATFIGTERPVSASAFNFLQTTILILLTLPLCYLYGVTGAVIGLLLSQVFWSISVFLGARFLQIRTWAICNQAVSTAMARRLGAYMLSGVLAGIAGPLSLLLIRTHSTTVLGALNVGLYQALQSTSVIYIGIIATIISTYYYPKFSKIQRAAIRANKFFIIIEPLLISLGLFLLFGGIFFFLREIFFAIAFSDEFVQAGQFVVYQLVGDFLRIITMIGSYFLLARGEQLKFITIELIGATSFVTLVYYLVNDNVIEIFYSYVIASFITMLASIATLTFTIRKTSQ